MTARIVSARVVHTWRKNVFRILRLGNSIDGEIACTVSDRGKDLLWVGLQDGRISAVNLAECPTSSVVIDLAPFFFNKAQTVSASVGELYGILVPASPSRCVLEAFGSSGWVRFSGAQKILHRADWPSPLDALTHVTLLNTGGLRDAVAPSGHALLAADACGRIFLARATCLGDALRGNVLSSAQIVDLNQSVAGVSVSPDGNFVAVVGELRTVAVLYGRAGADEVVSAVRAFLPGDSASLDARQLHCDFLSDGRLRITAMEYEQALIVSAGDCGVPVCRTEPTDVLRTCVKENDNDDAESGDIGESLAALLRGIEQAGALQEAAEERARRADARLASFNAALLFALQNRFRTEALANGKTGDVAIECTFSGAMVPAPESPQFFVAPAWVGVNAFVNVHLKSKCTIAVGAGWNLRLTIDDKAGSSKNANTSISSDANCRDSMLDTDVSLPRANTGVNTSQSAYATQLSVAFPGLAAFGETTLSFPVALTSHRPLYVSLDLHYTLAAHARAYSQLFAAAPELSRGLSLPLAKCTVLDILTFSAPTTVRVPDTAHRRLRGARLSQALSPPSSPKRDPLPLSTRLSVPVSSATLLEALHPLKVASPTGALYRSFLGAEFALEPVPQPTDNAACAQLTLRAPPLALPFLRAAVLRRVARAAVRDVVAGSAGAADAWERRLVDAVEDSVPLMREAERAVADFAALGKCIEQGRLEFCHAGEDLRAAKKAVVDLERATQSWRQAVRKMWDPDAG